MMSLLKGIQEENKFFLIPLFFFYSSLLWNEKGPLTLGSEVCFPEFTNSDFISPETAS